MRLGKILFPIPFLILAGSSLTLLQGCSSDSSSSSSPYTCAAACADNIKNFGSRSSQVKVQEQFNQSECNDLEASIPTDAYSEPVCANSLFETPPPGGCGATGALFLVRFNVAFFVCLSPWAPDPTELAACIEGVFSNREWPYPAGQCIECGVTVGIDFQSCIDIPEDLTSSDLSLCAEQYSLDLNACSP